MHPGCRTHLVKHEAAVDALTETARAAWRRVFLSAGKPETIVNAKRHPNWSGWPGYHIKHAERASKALLSLTPTLPSVVDEQHKKALAKLAELSLQGVSVPKVSRLDAA
jgi:hypothetical protein